MRDALRNVIGAGSIKLDRSDQSALLPGGLSMPGTRVHLAGGGTPEDPLPPGGFDAAPYQWPVGVATGPEALQAPEGSAVPATPLPPLTLDQLKLRAAGSEPGPLVTTGPFAYPTKATEDDIYGSGQEGAIQAIGVPDWGDMPKIPVKKDKKGRPIKLTKKQQDRQNEITKVATRARGEATEQAAKEQQYARNAVVAAHHSPIAAMGLDTRHLRIIDNMVEQSGNIGEYIPPGGREPHGLLRPDEMGADAAYPSTAIHESVHRGMQLLRDKYPDQFKKIVGKSEMPLVEEYMVRGLEQKVFGNIEMSEERQALDAKYPGIQTTEGPGTSQVKLGNDLMPYYEPVINGLEALAQHHIAKTRPGGPR